MSEALETLGWPTVIALALAVCAPGGESPEKFRVTGPDDGDNFRLDFNPTGEPLTASVP